MTHVASDLAEVWLSPSPRLLVLRRWELAAFGLVLAVAGALVGAAAGGGLGAGVGIGVAVVVAAGLEPIVRRRVRAWGYAEREDDLLVRRGVLFRRLSVVPYGRMQFVDVTAGPFERAFGLATVKMHTAAAASDARIPGLPEAVANRLRDQLASLGEARAAGL